MNIPGKKGNRQEDPGQEGMAGFDHTGAYLRKLRTEKGLSVGEACEATRISEINLRAMEEQDFAALPAETFTRGLLTIYARYLGAEPAHVVPRFMREREQSQAHGKRGKPRSVSHQILTPKKLAEPAHISSITMALMLLLFIVVLFTGFCLYTSWNPFSFLIEDTATIPSPAMHALPGTTAEPKEIDPSPPEDSSPTTTATVPDTATPGDTAPAVTTPEETAPAASTPPATTAAAAAPAATTPEESKGVATEPVVPGEGSGRKTPHQDQPAEATAAATADSATDRVTVEFLKDTRLILTRDHQEIVNARFKKGEKRSWPVTGSLQLSFDQAESAVILVGGQQLPFPGEGNGPYLLQLPADLPRTADQ